MTGPQRPIPGKDDVDGHAISIGKADAETTEGDNDTEGHVFVQQPPPEGHSTPSSL